MVMFSARGELYFDVTIDSRGCQMSGNKCINALDLIAYPSRMHSASYQDQRLGLTNHSIIEVHMDQRAEAVGNFLA